MRRAHGILALMLLSTLIPLTPSLAGPIAGTPPQVESIRTVTILDNPSPDDTHYIAYSYPIRLDRDSLTMILAYYSGDHNETIFTLTTINITTGRYTQETLLVLNGTPIQPLLHGDNIIVGSAGPKGITLYKVNTTSMEAVLACNMTTALGQPLVTIMVYGGPEVYLYTVERTWDNTRHYLIYTLDNETLCPKGAPGIVPVEWTVAPDGDVLSWMGEEIVFPDDPWYKPVTLPAVERVDATGEVVFALYSLIPRPSMNMVVVRHALVAPNGSIISTTDYTFHNATWGRIYREQVSHATALDPSTTLTIALHDEDATNKYIIVAGALGLLSVATNSEAFGVSTGASAGTLGFFYSISDGILYDSTGQPYNLTVETYSALLWASRLDETTALLLVQGRESGYYTGTSIILVRVSSQPPRTLWNTEQTLGETTYYWTPPTPKPVETITPPPATTTTTTSITTTTPLPSPQPGAQETTTTQTQPTTTTATRTTPAYTGEGPKTTLKPGDWAVYEGYIEYGGQKIEFSIRINVTSVTDTGITIAVTQVEFRGEPGVQTIPLHEGLQLEYRYGEPPACIGYGLDLFSFWADPARLPEDGVIEGSEGGVEYRCVYDKQTGLLTEYYSSYELLGTKQTIYYKLQDSSLQAGGLPKYWYVIAILGALAAITGIALLLRARRRHE